MKHLKNVALAASLVWIGYNLDYLIECSKTGWQNGRRGEFHPYQDAVDIYENKYKK